MVGEVDKIIRNALLKGESIFLPGVGSLTVERQAAVRTSRTTVEPPRKCVIFSDNRIGHSIIDEIAGLGVEPEQAHELYNEWRVQACSEGVLSIDGVGSLHNEIFSTDKALLALLNPHGTTAAIVKPRHDKLLYIFAAMCCLFALCVAGYVWLSYGDKEAYYPSPKVEPVGAGVNVVPETTEVAETSETPAEGAIETVAAESKPEQLTPAEPAKATSEDKNTVLRSTSGRSYVVLGIFSTEENAFKAVQNAEKSYPAADCRVYRYADKFMVSLYEGENSKECLEYMRTVKSLFPDLWIYNKK